jgi:hypothetical protein
LSYEISSADAAANILVPRYHDPDRSSSTWCEQGIDVLALASKSHHQAFVFSARPLPFGAGLWMGLEG